ncbi:MAG: hypothetical protein DVS81_00325 [Candidatus Accumulibacter meliphilus]|jgi:hypothetical protein|uniref:Uncharacterized protein n=1 Tax=Candidatus Accumulibacter meliphilus TaxID=2211374 RepID=A0A369XTV5_9PROT|nr:MAG: hypothetical protein DVS81_00325 [Candidatus Accumulibacter meliphilus]
MVDYTTFPLRRYYAFYTAGFFIFILILAFLERHGLPPRWIGYSFLFRAPCQCAVFQRVRIPPGNFRSGR